MAFLGHSMWPNDIAAGHNGQAESDEAPFASWDDFKKSQEHSESFNLVKFK